MRKTISEPISLPSGFTQFDMFILETGVYLTQILVDKVHDEWHDLKCPMSLKHLCH